MKTVHLLISGKVQGVFFRETSRRMAEKLNIKGWIKNTEDGKVEVLITGQEKKIEEFVKWCRKGPEKARVDDVNVSDQPTFDFEKFEVMRRK
ncbi:MAG: acylphosphatase [Ginsengibacter sp.]